MSERCDRAGRGLRTARFVRLFRLIGTAGIGVIFVAGCGSDADERVMPVFPHKPIKVIVPFAAGGGSDQFVRILQKALRDEAILPDPLVVINVPGAGGTIGSRRVKDARADGYTILNLHEAIITAKYSGISSYGPEAFVPIAATGRAGMVVCVSEDSAFEDFGALVGAAVGTPESVIFGANVGAPSFFVGRRIEAAIRGCAFRYVQTGGGAKRFASLKGGHIHASAFSIAEYFQFREGGLRALAYLGDERHPDAPGIPTAREQGVDVVSSNLHFWWAPRGTPPERVEWLGEALEAAMRTTYVREKLAELRVDPVVFTGEELRREIETREAAVAAVGIVGLGQLPNMPVAVIILVVVLGAGVLFQWWRGRAEAEAPEMAGGGFFCGRWAGVIGVSTAYVAAMRAGWLGFPMATIFFVPALGILWRGGGLKALPALLGVGAALGWGCYFLFTRVLVIDLP